MGISFIQDYTWTEHFEERALERFHITPKKLKGWVTFHASTATVYEPKQSPHPGHTLYRSKDNVVLVCNTVDKVFLTCYAGVGYAKDNTYISANNASLFAEEVLHLHKRYQLKNAKDILLSVSDDLEAFHSLSDRLMNSRVTTQYYDVLEDFLSAFARVKAAVGIISEDKSKGFIKSLDPNIKALELASLKAKQQSEDEEEVDVTEED